MTAINNTSTWHCNDLGLAAYLEVQLGQPAEVIPPDSPSGYCTFSFPYSDEVQQVIGDWGRDGPVPAIQYYRALSSLKRRVAQARQGAGR